MRNSNTTPGSSETTRRRLLAGTAAAGVTAVAGCLSSFGGTSGGSANEITHGAVRGGTTGGLVNVIKAQGIDRDNDLEIATEYFTSPPRVQQQIVYNDQIPTGFMGSFVATRLHADENASNPEIAGPYQLYHMHVLVRSDSDIESPADLAGKRISWASESADAWLKFVTVLNMDHGVDPDDLEFVQTAPPASTELLANGELDAILQYEPLVTKALIDHDLRVLYSPRSAWERLNGLPLTTVDLAWTRSWYEENTALAQRLATSFEQGQQYITENLGTVLEENADLFGLETDQQIARANERLDGIYPTEWSSDLFDSEYQIVERANELGLVEFEPTREIFREDL
jgi:ABC-type nitrate/sulfonate/bicarbonate transport system substrate-binding protein